MILAGCDRQPVVKAPAAPAPQAVADPVPEPGVTLHQIDPAGLAAQVASLPGKVVLVDYWATWCPPCRERFSHLVEWHKKYSSQGLVVISVACDDKDKTDEILAFLKEQNATFQNLRSAFGSMEKTFEGFSIDGGALPHCKLYDRKGQLRHTFAADATEKRTFTPEDVEEAIAELLAPEKEPEKGPEKKPEEPPAKDEDSGEKP
ncbi:MAG: TlpA family protein disulfide reductase [Planctomycetia bacterium]|nr:TlpA family protein disulfide reductase [Planctomycetia bacterium]